MNLFDVGKIVNTHGLKGEIRVLSSTDFPEERFAPGTSLYIEKNGQKPTQVTIRTHRTHKTFDLLTLEGIDSINEAEPLVGCLLKVNEKDLQDLPEEEYYYHQIIGLSVKNETGEKLGSIKEILSPGANDVWVVQREGKKDLLLPYIDDVVLNVDLPKGIVTVRLLEGLDEE